MNSKVLKRTSWLLIITLFITSFFTFIPSFSYGGSSVGLDTFVKKLAGYGVPSIVMVYLVATSGLTGAAAITASLAALGGPWGMIGGIFTLVLLKEISEYVAEYGMGIIMRGIAEDLKQKGKSNDEIIKEINEMPIISASSKSKIIEEICRTPSAIDFSKYENANIDLSELDFIININASKILSMPEIQTSIREEFEKQPEQKKTYEELKSKSGFDPLKDINNIIVFSSEKVIEDNNSFGGALIEGKFDIEKIINVIKADEKAMKDVNITKVDGFYAVLPKNSNDGFGMFLDNRYVVVGSEVGCLALKTFKTRMGKDFNKYSLFGNRVDYNSTLSGNGRLSSALKDKCKLNPNTAVFVNVDSFYFDFNNDNSFILNAKAIVNKSENVNDVMNSINGYIAMIKMFSAQVPEITEAVNMLTASSEGTTIKLNLNIPAAKVAEIKAKLQEKAKQMQEQQSNESNGPRNLF